jgi:putative membrane-bound dehydrogenase-like protein
MRLQDKISIVAGLVAALLALHISSAADADTTNSGWRLVSVPGTNHHAKTAWYRAWVKVPDSFFATHERNLFEESVGIYIRDLTGAHEVWMNGRRLGVGGSFPPNYQSGQEQLHRHKVPTGTLHKDQWNEIAIRVYQPEGTSPAGFLGPAPFIMDYFLECVFDGLWEFRSGENYSPGGARTNKPASAAFDKFRESSRVLGRAAQVHGPKLTPAESAAKLRPASDFVAELLLSEPLVAQPTHFSFDERGRLWVAQYRQYPYPAGLTMLSRDKYYRAHYDKIPPAPPDHDRGADIISIHEDTNGDGVFERHKVFLDGLNMANAVVRGHGGVWVMHTPYLLFYPDKNGDDVPEGPPEVRLAGFGLEDTHSVANGLIWGPDGWLYGGQGSTTSCRVTRPGLDPTNASPVYFEGCMVWRYHPQTRAFEIFAEGGGNTFGLELDAQGRIYSGHNGGGTRGWHFVQGGFYLMQGVDPGKFGPPRNPYAFGELSMMRTTNNAIRFTHFGAFAEGTGMPSPSSGLLFALDPLHNVILTSERRRRGATFETVDREPALRSDDETFRPLYIANAPDGSLFFSDMCEFYIAHGQHYQNQIDPTTGRIYRLRGKDATLEKDTNLEGKTTEELVDLLSHPNKWHRQTAVRLLGERRDVKAVPKLRRVIEENPGLGALHALWALYQITRFESETETIKKALQHSYPPVRMWTVRLLGDEYGLNRGLGVGRHGRARDGVLWIPLYEPLAAQVRREEDPEVLSQMASTARRLTAAQAMDLAGAVMSHQAVKDDPFIPQLCWWIFEAHVPPARDDNDYVRLFFNEPGVWDMPIVFDYILPRLARRYAVEGKSADLLVCAELFRLAPSARHAAQLMKGLEEAFRGRPMVGLPDELVAAITKSGQAPLLFRVKQGEPGAMAQALQQMQDDKVKTEDRVALARAFGETHHRPAVPALLDLVSGSSANSLRVAALHSLMTYDDAGIGAKAVELLPRLNGDVQMAAFTLLASRLVWSLGLLHAVETGAIKSSLFPDEVANRLRSSKEKQVSDLAARVLPQPISVSGEFAARINEINSMLQRAPGNPYAGESTFMTRCAACHKLFFKGGNIGPDLTAYQRDNLGTMLLSIINPNAEIREGFQYYSVETKDGRTLSGFFVDRDNQVMVLRGLAGENITLRAAEILEVQPMGRSLMPEGLLDGMSEQEIRDFFAYLRISQPITN